VSMYAERRWAAARTVAVIGRQGSHDAQSPILK
jgi:hypothetical protein